MKKLYYYLILHPCLLLPEKLLPHTWQQGQIDVIQRYRLGSCQFPNNYIVNARFTENVRNRCSSIFTINSRIPGMDNLTHLGTVLSSMATPLAVVKTLVSNYITGDGLPCTEEYIPLL